MKGLFGLLLLVASIFAVIKIWKSDATDGSKILWTLLIVFLPLIGIIAWYFAGPGDKALNRL